MEIVHLINSSDFMYDYKYSLILNNLFVSESLLDSQLLIDYNPVVSLLFVVMVAFLSERTEFKLSRISWVNTET